MKRRVFTIFAALSLLLCVATTVLWVRSYYIGDSFERRELDTEWSIDITPGHISICRGNDPARIFDRGDTANWRHRGSSPGGQIWWRRSLAGRGVSALGLVYCWSHPHPAVTGFRLIAMPFWFICLTLAALAAWAIRSTWLQRRLQRRLRLGLCPTCGYDLRASKERCPECGQPVISAPHKGKALV